MFTLFEHAWFHMAVEEGAPGQAASEIVMFAKPSEILKASSHIPEAVFIWEMTFSLRSCWLSNAPV
jgi:hypothetical protein